MYELNDNQNKAVEHGKGPALVVAGAGTGKTSVIVERITKLINGGVDKSSILALTFTEKAAQEMVDRVGERLEQSYGVELNIFTFNAFGQEMLREFSSEIGLSPDLRLIGDIGKVVLLRDNLDELGLDYFAPVSNPEGQLNNIGGYFSKLKQQLVKPESYIAYAQKLKSDSEEAALEQTRHLELANAYKTYIQTMRSHNTIDYDDQIYLLIELLEQRPNIKKLLNQRYRYVLVDEFQDTNPMQSRLIELLLNDDNNIMAVGDDDQSIYGWRGATLSNILDFTNRYKDTKEITLVDNYRSTQPILDVAYRLIQNNNPNRLESLNNLDKKLVSHVKEGTDPVVEQFENLDSEMDWIARDIARRIKGGASPGSIAVLTRRNAGAKRVSEMLNFHAVSHTLSGVSSDMYTHPTVANMIEALKAVTDPSDNTALYHTLTGPLFNESPHLIGELASDSRRKHLNLWRVLEGVDDLKKSYEIINKWRAVAHEKSVSALSYQILDESGLKDELYSSAELNDEAAQAVRALGQWFETMREFQSISSIATTVVYLENFDSLRAGGETLDDTSFESDLPVVMSVHKAKGLEWDTVYIADCTEYSFPLKNTRSSLEVPDELSVSSAADDHMAEERRLMYVACTRAKLELIMTHSDTHTGTTKRKPSRFLIEMFGEDALGASGSSGHKQTTLNLFDSNNEKPVRPSIPSKMKVGSDIVLTASQLNDYLRCPLDFYYRHVLGVPAEANAAGAVGTTFHAILQDINQAKIRGNPVPKLNDLQSRLEENWPQEGYLSAKQRDRALSVAKNSLSATYERVVKGPTPISSEESFRIRVPDSNVIITGRIDAVLATDNGVEIVDYKTSTSATTPEKAKRSATGSKQLEMYALAWREKHGEMPAKVSLDFVQTNQVGTVSKRESTIDNLSEKIAKVGESIMAGEFPHGRSHDYCRHPQ